MRIDLDALMREPDLRLHVYSGVSYWLLFLKGYLQHHESGTIAGGNIYYDYLMGHYAPDLKDPGLVREFATPQSAVERVIRRFQDLDLFRAGGPEIGRTVAPVRIIVSEPPPPHPLLVYEMGSEIPLCARLVDGWHRLFAAKLCGVPSLPCEIEDEANRLDPMSAGIEEFVFDGRRLSIRGWCSVANRNIQLIEVRVNGRTIARTNLTERADVKNPFPGIAHAKCHGFVIDSECNLPVDRPIIFRVLALENWLLAGATEISWPHGGDETLNGISASL